MDNSRKIDVVVVNYNNTNDTIECIDSVLKSQYPIRFIFIVDNSDIVDDNLFLRYKYSSSIHYIKASHNLGFAGANNIGVKESLARNSDYILLLNNDTTVKIDFLDNLLLGIDSQNASIATGKIYYYGSDTIWGAGGWMSWAQGLGRLYGLGEKDHGQYDSLKEISFASGCMMLVKSKVFEQIGFFDIKYFMYHEDLDFCIRASKAHLKIIYVPTSIIWHKIGASCVNKTPFIFYYLFRNSIIITKNYASILNKILFIFIGIPYFIVKGLSAQNISITYLYSIVLALNDGIFGNLHKRFNL